MLQVVRGVTENIQNYRSHFEKVGVSQAFGAATVGKQGVLELTGPLAFSKIIWPILHNYPHLLVNGFQKLGVEFYKLQSYQSLRHTNGGLGCGTQHYSKLKTKIVLDEPDLSWSQFRCL